MIKRTWIRIWIVVVIISVIWFSDWSFAAEGNDEFWSLAWTINFVVNVLSWIWILFAKMAWEFLTNKWVYGSIVGLDSLLWKYRNIIKNMANFGLWFYFVYIIFKALIAKEEITKKIKDVLLWILIAWVWIQASWFITAAIIDVSTITLVAAGSLPSQIISQNDRLRTTISNSLSDLKKEGQGGWEFTEAKYLDLFSKDSAANKFLRTSYKSLEQPKSEEEIFDALMPNGDNISWPLYYMWVSILDVYRIPGVGTNSKQDTKKTIFNLVVQWWTTVVYSLEMFVLLVLAFMRVIYMWLFIILSPIVVLVECIKKAEWKWWKLWFLESLTKQVNIKSFLLNVFKPTIIVLWISLSMMLVVLMNSKLGGDPNNKTHPQIDMWWVLINSNIEVGKEDLGDKTYTTSINAWSGEIDFSGLGKWIFDFLLSVVTVILVYFVIKIAVDFWNWKDFVSKNVGKIQKGVGDLFTDTPIVPVAGYDSTTWDKKTRFMSLGSTLWVGDHDSIAKQRVVNKNTEYKNESSKDLTSIMNMWWMGNGNSLTPEQKTGIESAWFNDLGMQSLNKKRSYIQGIKTEWWKWMNLNPSLSDWFWIKQFEDWLEKSDWHMTAANDGVWNDMVVRWNKEENKKSRSLQKMFDRVTWAAETYANFFGYTTWEYKGFKDIMNLDISKK